MTEQEDSDTELEVLRETVLDFNRSSKGAVGGLITNSMAGSYDFNTSLRKLPKVSFARKYHIDS